VHFAGWPAADFRTATAVKHGISFFEALVMLTKGEPWMPAAV